MQLELTVNGVAVSKTLTASEAASFAAAHARAIESLDVGPGQDGDTPMSARPGYAAAEGDWISGVISRHCLATGENPSDVLDRCIASWL